MALVAITRGVSPAIGQCELTHLERHSINVEHARLQHDLYVDTLREFGCKVIELAPNPSLPDSVFVEDTAVILDEIGILTRPGAESRRPEVPPMAAILSSYRTLGQIKDPGTLDGGDVLRVGRQLWVGCSERSNADGRHQLRILAEDRGYEVFEVPFDGCLHLKTAVTALADGILLLNPAWIEAKHFPGFEIIEVDPAEPFAANMLAIGNTIIAPARAKLTTARVRDRGLTVQSVEMTELAKAEAGVTCCSLIIDGRT